MWEVKQPLIVYAHIQVLCKCNVKILPDYQCIILNCQLYCYTFISNRVLMFALFINYYVSF